MKNEYQHLLQEHEQLQEEKDNLTNRLHTTEKELTEIQNEHKVLQEYTMKLEQKQEEQEEVLHEQEENTEELRHLIHQQKKEYEEEIYRLRTQLRVATTSVSQLEQQQQQRQQQHNNGDENEKEEETSGSTEEEKTMKTHHHPTSPIVQQTVATDDEVRIHNDCDNNKDIEHEHDEANEETKTSFLQQQPQQQEYDSTKEQLLKIQKHIPTYMKAGEDVLRSEEKLHLFKSKIVENLR